MTPSTPPPPAEPDLDRGILFRIRDAGDDDLVRTVIDLYIESAPGYAARIREALERGDPKAVREACHLLRGGALNLGAVRVASVAGSAERAAEGGDLAAAGDLLRDLPAAMVAAEAALRKARPAAEGG